MMGLAPGIGRERAHHVVKHACGRAGGTACTLADALSRGTRVSAHTSTAPHRPADTDPAKYLGLAPQMVDRVLAASKR